MTSLFFLPGTPIAVLENGVPIVALTGARGHPVRAQLTAKGFFFVFFFLCFFFFVTNMHSVVTNLTIILSLTPFLCPLLYRHETLSYTVTTPLLHRHYPSLIPSLSLSYTATNHSPTPPLPPLPLSYTATIPSSPLLHRH